MEPGELRHALTGTICPGPFCEECATAWALTGNLYFAYGDQRPLAPQVGELGEEDL